MAPLWVHRAGDEELGWEWGFPEHSTQPREFRVCAHMSLTLRSRECSCKITSVPRQAQHFPSAAKAAWIFIKQARASPEPRAHTEHVCQSQPGKQGWKRGHGPAQPRHRSTPGAGGLTANNPNPDPNSHLGEVIPRAGDAAVGFQGDPGPLYTVRSVGWTQMVPTLSTHRKIHNRSPPG